MAIQDITFTILLTVLFSNYILIDSAKTIIKRNSGDDIIKYDVYGSYHEKMEVNLKDCRTNTLFVWSIIDGKGEKNLHDSPYMQSENMEMLEGKKDLVIHEPSTLLDKVSLKVGIYDGFLVCSVEYTLHLHRIGMPKITTNLGVVNEDRKTGHALDFVCGFPPVWPSPDITVTVGNRDVASYVDIARNCNDRATCKPVVKFRKNAYITTPTDNGKLFTCKGTAIINGVLEVIGESTYNIDVEYIPHTPTIKSSHKKIYKNETAELICEVNSTFPGNPYPNIAVWMIDGIYLDYVGVNIEVLNGEVETRNYSCKLRNQYGISKYSAVFILDLLGDKERPATGGVKFPSNKTALIIGVIVGILLLIAVIAIVAIVCIRKRGMSSSDRNGVPTNEGYSTNGTKSTQSKESMPLQMRTDTIRSCQDSFPPQKPPRTYENERPDIYEKYFENQNGGNVHEMDDNDNKIPIYSIANNRGTNRPSLGRKPVHSYVAPEIIYADLHMNPGDVNQSVEIEDDDRVIYTDIAAPASLRRPTTEL